MDSGCHLAPSIGRHAGCPPLRRLDLERQNPTFATHTHTGQSTLRSSWPCGLGKARRNGKKRRTTRSTSGKRCAEAPSRAGGSGVRAMSCCHVGCGKGRGREKAPEGGVAGSPPWVQRAHVVLAPCHKPYAAMAGHVRRAGLACHRFGWRACMGRPTGHGVAVRCWSGLVLVSSVLTMATVVSIPLAHRWLRPMPVHVPSHCVCVAFAAHASAQASPPPPHTHPCTHPSCTHARPAARGGAVHGARGLPQRG